ncbi:hypothetical protein A5634_01280 [Mycobacterium asiaticum]|uniref:Secretion protein n=1 Tax=Mycobacterium asiaticum TaxID=1790 RepID=A0A1A3P399_MYCAS|nr:DUF2563 family protein [Mycobacterium asiaticum]OBK28733.1 hypothetical protein A5634_01280 [Mycobacterium asiaticum]
MFVDPALLRSGGSESRRASEHIDQAAEHLSRASMQSQLFGDFAAADTFHAATGAVLADHARVMSGNSESLGAVSRSAHVAAASFTAMDESNAAAVEVVRCNFAT